MQFALRIVCGINSLFYVSADTHPFCCIIRYLGCLLNEFYASLIDILVPKYMTYRVHKPRTWHVVNEDGNLVESLERKFEYRGRTSFFLLLL